MDFPTELWKITIFNGKTHYKWPFSIAKVTAALCPRNTGGGAPEIGPDPGRLWSLVLRPPWGRRGPGGGDEELHAGAAAGAAPAAAAVVFGRFGWCKRRGQLEVAWRFKLWMILNDFWNDSWSLLIKYGESVLGVFGCGNPVTLWQHHTAEEVGHWLRHQPLCGQSCEQSTVPRCSW